VFAPTGLGFQGNELKVSIEPRRITILGEKEVSATETEGRKMERIAWNPGQILQVIDLATDVTAESAVVELQAGLLKFELPKAARQEVEPAATAACLARNARPFAYVANIDSNTVSMIDIPSSVPVLLHRLLFTTEEMHGSDCVKKRGKARAVQKMKVGPSESSCRRRHVGVGETNASEPLETHRKCKDDIETRASD
jgi:Hsp20/alpha crystallin family